MVNRVCLLLLGVILPITVACASPASGGATAGGAANNAAPQQLTVKSMDTMKFDPATLTAKAGQPIQLTLDNSGGQLAHDFYITDNVPQPVQLTAQPGQKASTTFTISQPGTYTFYCNQPGHRQAGMQGTLTIQ